MEITEILERLKSTTRLTRNLTIDSAKVSEVDENTLELSISSEEPYERWFGIEILGHEEGEIDLSRLNNKANLLYNHDRDTYLAVIEKTWIDENKKLRVRARFSKRSIVQDYLNDVKDGILTHTSVGYEPIEMVLIKEEKGEIPIYRVTKWMPYEGSLVTIAADDGVGYGRSLTPGTPENKTTDINNSKKEPIMDPVTPVTPTEPVINMENERKKIREDETSRINQIATLCRTYEKYGLNFDEVKEKSLAEVKDIVIDLTQKAEAERSKFTPSGMEEKDLSKFSILRGIEDITRGKRGYETEITEHLQKQYGRPAGSEKSLIIPVELQMRAISNILHQKSLLVASSATLGGNLIGTTHLGEMFVDALRAVLLSGGLGAQILTGLKGDGEIPIQTGAATALYEDENEDSVESNPTFGLKEISPKRISVWAQYSNKLLKQSDPSIDMLVVADLIFAILEKADWGFFAGTGTGMPYGIVNTVGVSAVTAAPGTFETVHKFPASIRNNKAPLDFLQWVLSPSTRAKYEVTPVVAGYPRFICEDEKLAGYKTNLTTNVADGTMIFGDFRKALIAFWGGMEIILDNITGAKKNNFIIYANQYSDSIVKQPAAFAIATDSPYINLAE